MRGACVVLELDHLTVIAPTLPEGVAHIRESLGIDVPFGRRHRDMGTHNHLLRLSDRVYLEIIAVDPAAPRPARPRWFGLGDETSVRTEWDEGRRLRGWVASTSDMDAALSRHGSRFGEKATLSGTASDFDFTIPPDGSLPGGGLFPSVICRRGAPSPVGSMPDLGAELIAFAIEHPEPDRVREFYDGLAIAGAPVPRRGARMRYRAIIGTPGGERELA
jgi:hypothetical protein